jgi:predicted ATPase
VEDWSCALLSEPEPVLREQLSVFAGGWTLEAAEAVFDPADTKSEQRGEARGLVFETLGRLIDKSIVMTEQTGTETR